MAQDITQSNVAALRDRVDRLERIVLNFCNVIWTPDTADARTLKEDHEQDADSKH